MAPARLVFTILLVRTDSFDYEKISHLFAALCFLEIAIVTHKGAAADAGHYMAFVKKSVFHATKGTTPHVPGTTGASVEFDEDDEDWYRFDDDKVSIFPKEKLVTLDGGGVYPFHMILDHLSPMSCRRRLSRICFIVSKQASCMNGGFQKMCRESVDIGLLILICHMMK